MNYVGRDPSPVALTLVGDTNPVGMIAWFHGAPDGSWLRVNGQTIAKASYPDLWAYAQGFLTADQTANPGLYLSVDANNFKVPKLDGLFIRAQGQFDANRVSAALGVRQDDGLISHFHFVTGTGGGGGASGVQGNAGGGPLGGLNTSAQGGALTESRPANVALVPCVKALRSTLVPSTGPLGPGMLAPGATVNVLGPTVCAPATSVDLAPIPVGVRRVMVMLAGISTVGASNIILQLGRAGSVIENTGYLCSGGRLTSASSAENQTNGFALSIARAAASTTHGLATLCLLDPATNTWVMSATLGHSDAAHVNPGGGSKALAGPLASLRITTGVGTEAFDAGSVGLMYE